MRIVFICLFSAVCGLSQAATIVEWDFTLGLQGWQGNSSISSMTITAEGLEFDCVAEDPNLVGPAVDYSDWVTEQVVIRMRSGAADNNGKLFYGTNFSEAQSVSWTIQNDNQWHTYTIPVPELGSNWRLRVDPCDLTGAIAVAWIRVEGSARSLPDELVLDNGTLRLKLDLLSGGSITYLSLSGTTQNIINIHDRGRMIQQSYYAGQSLDRRGDGQHPSWSPWSWNPIQVGDAYGNSGTVLEATVVNGVAYTKTHPLLWDMNNEFAQAYIEQWTSLDGSVVHLRNRLTCFRDTGDLWDQIRASHQELPAIYTIADLPYLYTYSGDRPWENQPLTRIINDPDDGFIWDYFSANEFWAANVDSTAGDGWGLGVYNPVAAPGWVGGLAGTVGGGPYDGSTAYISPLDTVALSHSSVLEYEYDLIVGTLSEIRQYVYDQFLSSANQGAVWLFDQSGDYEGWSIVQHISPHQVQGGVLSGSITGSDPIMLSPGIQLPAVFNRYLHIRMKTTPSTHRSAEVFWTNENGPPSSNNRMAFQLANHGNFENYTFDMSEHAWWNGTISQLRFDPLNGESSGQFEIDYIVISNSASFDQKGSHWQFR